jgi:hypothetical protein
VSFHRNGALATALRLAIGCRRYDEGGGRKDSGPAAKTFLLRTESFAGRETSDAEGQTFTTGKAHAMSQRLIRYRVKADKVEENQKLVEGVFRELHAKSPAQVRYLVLRLSDGTFCHLVDDATRTVPSLDAFAAFQRGGADRRLDEPQQLEATVVGNYRMLLEP